MWCLKKKTLKNHYFIQHREHYSYSHKHISLLKSDDDISYFNMIIQKKKQKTKKRIALKPKVKMLLKAVRVQIVQLYISKVKRIFPLKIINFHSLNKFTFI